MHGKEIEQQTHGFIFKPISIELQIPEWNPIFDSEYLIKTPLNIIFKKHADDFWYGIDLSGYKCSPEPEDNVMTILPGQKTPVRKYDMHKITKLASIKPDEYEEVELTFEELLKILQDKNMPNFKYNYETIKVPIEVERADYLKRMENE